MVVRKQFAALKLAIQSLMPSEIAQIKTDNALRELGAPLKEFHAVRIPPPAEFTGVGRIECFFEHFERYARCLYKEDTDSYRKILPQFLRGEAREIVNSFGYGSEASYETVKERVITVLNEKKTIGTNAFSELLAMSREPDESLTCYRIRLEVAAETFTAASAEAREIMVYTLLVACLP